MGRSSSYPLSSAISVANELKASKEAQKAATPVVDVGDCPSRDKDEFWDWMGKCVDADGRDIGADLPGVFSSSSSGPKPVITIPKPLTGLVKNYYSKLQSGLCWDLQNINPDFLNE